MVFEIIDLANDDPHLQTVPQTIGVKWTKCTGLLLLVPFCSLELFISTFNVHDLFISLIMVITLMLFIVFANPNRSKYYTSFWVESVPIFWWLMVIFIKKPKQQHRFRLNLFCFCSAKALFNSAFASSSFSFFYRSFSLLSFPFIASFKIGSSFIDFLLFLFTFLSRSLLTVLVVQFFLVCEIASLNSFDLILISSFFSCS